MSDENKVAPVVTEPNSTQVAEDGSGKESMTIETALKIIQDLRKENASHRTKLKTHEESVAQAREEEAKKRGEYEQLYTSLKSQHKALTAEVEAIRSAQEAEWTEMVKDWNDDDKALIPPNLSIAEKLAYTKKLANRLKANANGGVPTTTGSRTGPFGGYSDAEEWATKDPAGYLKHKKLLQH